MPEIADPSAEVLPQDIQVRRAPPVSRWRTFNAFIDSYMRRLGGPEIVIWLTLFRHGDKKGFVKWVPQTRMARITGLSMWSVKKACQALRRGGFIRTIIPGKPGTCAELQVTLPPK